MKSAYLAIRQKFVDTLKRFNLYIPIKRGKDVLWDLFNDKSKERIRMSRFYSQFIKRGDVCFDIGANMGSRVDIFLALGSRVVAVEPQSSCIKFLQRKYNSNPNVVILKAGVGDREKMQDMRICNA